MPSESKRDGYCPVCGFRTLSRYPHWTRHEVCPICQWEDDPVQSERPGSPVGANKVSLIEARENFREYGAVEPRLVDRSRDPTEDDERDPEWPY